MNKKAIISVSQLIFLLTIARVSFSSDYISAVNPGTSIQDIMVALPAVFLGNFLVALPVLFLLSRHPGHDLIDCSAQVLGKMGGAVIGVLLFAVFVIAAAYNIGPLYIWFNSVVIEGSSGYAVFVPIIVVCVYSAVKGVESIARFATIVFTVYVIISLIVYIPLISKIQLSHFTPMFYSGFGYFEKALLAGIDQSIEILPLAMLAPFLKTGTNLFRTYILWDALSMTIAFVLYFFIIGVLGALGSNQIFPLSTLSQISNLGIFERLDTVDLIAWVFDTVLSTALYIFAASQCVIKTRLRKKRRSVIVAIGVLILAAAPLSADYFLKYFRSIFSPAQMVVTMVIIFVIPLLLLVTDIIRGKMAGVE